MPKDSLNDVHICAEKVLMTTEELKNRIPVSDMPRPLSVRLASRLPISSRARIIACW